MNELPRRKRIFPDVTGVSRGEAIKLSNSGLINKQNTVVSWAYLSPFISNSMLKEPEAKQLILLELYRTDGQPVRIDIVDRLVRYLARKDRDIIQSKIVKEIARQREES